jgi:hypothetical protein
VKEEGGGEWGRTEGREEGKRSLKTGIKGDEPEREKNGGTNQ